MLCGFDGPGCSARPLAGGAVWAIPKHPPTPPTPSNPSSPPEDDESLTADEKALLRFQKQRLKEMAGSKFSLPEDEGEGGGGGGEQLTHMGRSLAELEDLGGGWGSDDDDANLDEQMTRDFHFGGGLFERKEGGGGGEGGEERPQRKSKKEVRRGRGALGVLGVGGWGW